MEYVSITYETTSFNITHLLKYQCMWHHIIKPGKSEKVSHKKESKDVVKSMILESDQFGFKSKLYLS